MRSVSTAPTLIVLLILLVVTIEAESFGAEKQWYAGTWDSTINNLMDHPKTVVAHIEVVDSETREPVPDAMISFEGKYWISPRTSRHSPTI